MESLRPLRLISCDGWLSFVANQVTRCNKGAGVELAPFCPVGIRRQASARPSHADRYDHGDARNPNELMSVLTINNRINCADNCRYGQPHLGLFIFQRALWERVRD
jgi:hypothetical protein